jgi:ribonuclease VapC
MARPGQLDCTFGAAQALVVDWLADNEIDLREPTSPGAVLSYAVAVADQLGVGKRALSNFDCFHYAHARAAGAPLLTLDVLLRQTDVETLP